MTAKPSPAAALAERVLTNSRHTSFSSESPELKDIVETLTAAPLLAHALLVCLEAMNDVVASGHSVFSPVFKNAIASANAICAGTDE